jgi:UPF0716 protein FxsA
MGKMLLLFILIPTVELVLLLQIGSLIGILPTIGIILSTGILGAALARYQGLGVVRQLHEEMRTGQMPAGPIVDGVFILIAAALLLTPGFLTDVFGFVCLMPASRAVMKRLVWNQLRRAVQDGNVNIYISGGRS